MARRCIWFLHPYSCLRTVDLETLYGKMAKRGLILIKSNSWSDCFEKKVPSDYQYKVIPASSSINNRNNNQWQLVGSNDKYNIFVNDERCERAEKMKDTVGKYSSCTSEILFLLAFPMCILMLCERFHIFENSILPVGLNWIFIAVSFLIYLGHIGALLTLVLQIRQYNTGNRRVTDSKKGFLPRFVISCLVNLLQIIIVIIAFYGINL